VGKAMTASSVATTVSPTYAREISGHPSIGPNLSKLFGIR
jgi:starch synthase